MMQRAGTQAQGTTAAAQARQSGMGNLLNLGVQAGGMMSIPPMGGGGGGGSTANANTMSNQQMNNAWLAPQHPMWQPGV